MKVTAEIVNGKISYLPHIAKPKDAEPFVKEWKDG